MEPVRDPSDSGAVVGAAAGRSDGADGFEETSATTDMAIVVLPSGSQRRAKIGLACAVAWISMLTLLAVFVDLLPLHSYDQFTSLGSRTAPGVRWPEFLGSDTVGRSILSRLIHGTRQSLQIGLFSVAIAATLGSLIGLTVGYLRGKIDEVVGVFLDALLAIPALVLLLAIAAIGSRNMTTLIVGLSIFLTAPFARLVRATTVSLSDREFVLAARAMGATRRRIMVREILPNVVPGVVSVVFLYAATVVVAEGTLSFLGLGIPPPMPSWGGMINEGRQHLDTSPTLVFIPSLMLLLTVISLRRIGEEIRVRLGRGSST